jgi:hypothetical protein
MSKKLMPKGKSHVRHGVRPETQLARFHDASRGETLARGDLTAPRRSADSQYVIVVISAGLCRRSRALRPVLVPRSVTAIERFAFAYCTSLLEVNFEGPSKMSAIERGAFDSCSSLQSLQIVGSVSTIADEFLTGFAVCEISVDEDNRHFQTIDQLLIAREGSAVILYSGGESEVVIPSQVVSLRYQSFAGRSLIRDTIQAIADSWRCIFQVFFAEIDHVAQFAGFIGIGGFQLVSQFEECDI